MNYKEALRKKYRFDTSKGRLTIEDLWDLSLEELDRVAIALNKKIKSNEGTTSFLYETPKEDLTNKNMLEIVLDVLETKKSENTERLISAEKRRETQKILEVIQRKEEEKYENMSLDELRELAKNNASDPQ